MSECPKIALCTCRDAEERKERKGKKGKTFFAVIPYVQGKEEVSLVKCSDLHVLVPPADFKVCEGGVIELVGKLPLHSQSVSLKQKITFKIGIQWSGLDFA